MIYLASFRDILSIHLIYIYKTRESSQYEILLVLKELINSTVAVGRLIIYYDFDRT